VVAAARGRLCAVCQLGCRCADALITYTETQPPFVMTQINEIK